MPFFKKWACKEKKVRRMSKILRIFACLFALFFVVDASGAGYTCSARPRNIHHANPDIICMVVQVPGIHVKNVRRGIRTRMVGTLVKACDIRHVKT